MKEKQVKYLVISVLILVIINISLLIVLILPRVHGGRDAHPFRAERNKGAQFLTQKLDLTPDQREEFRRLFQQHKARKDSLGKIIREYKMQLARQVTTGSKDNAVIDRLMTKLSEAHMADEKEQYQHFYQLSQICTPEQLSKLEIILQSPRHPHHGPPGP
ncbi:Spy/CpxP family protein refolding chaperone [Marinoscillum sp. MHG1-6]|uniref:Spy/CpxP family protein refolding chaperone n=1 Tax=Marinoscillum sp. MHG1-6 TaxID=2959627 RepID=UPI0021583533|nr:periplasmic heavy metal sensor [Marinoscillum sp. MHG1-6]